MTNSLKLIPAQPTSSPGVVASAAYADGRRVADIPIYETGDWSRKPGHVVWIGLHEPSLDLLRKVQVQFGLHELAIEDALDRRALRPTQGSRGDPVGKGHQALGVVEDRPGDDHLLVR